MGAVVLSYACRVTKAYAVGNFVVYELDCDGVGAVVKHEVGTARFYVSFEGGIVSDELLNEMMRAVRVFGGGLDG